jgi:hypothetical protein
VQTRLCWYAYVIFCFGYSLCAGDDSPNVEKMLCLYADVIMGIPCIQAMIRPPTVMSRLAAVATGKSTGVSDVLPDGTISRYGYGDRSKPFYAIPSHSHHWVCMPHRAI